MTTQKLYIPTDDEMRTLLQTYKHIAVVGLSADPTRPAHDVSLYMQRAGYTIIPINPRHAGQTIMGQRVYATLTEAQQAGEPIELVNVFRLPQAIPPVVDEAIKIGAKAIWVQLDLRNDPAGLVAQQAGLTYVQDHCIKMEHRRLLH